MVSMYLKALTSDAASIMQDKHNSFYLTDRESFMYLSRLIINAV